MSYMNFTNAEFRTHLMGLVQEDALTMNEAFDRAPTLYAIQATITRVIDGWESTRSLPTFYLDSRVQGILSEDHAQSVAEDILIPFGAIGGITEWNITAHKV